MPFPDGTGLEHEPWSAIAAQNEAALNGQHGPGGLGQPAAPPQFQQPVGPPGLPPALQPQGMQVHRGDSNLASSHLSAAIPQPDTLHGGIGSLQSEPVSIAPVMPGQMTPPGAGRIASPAHLQASVGVHEGVAPPAAIPPGPQSYVRGPGAAIAPVNPLPTPHLNLSVAAERVAGPPPATQPTPTQRERAAARNPYLNLDAATKLKCPKCDHVNKASAEKCVNCGHDMTAARKAKFAKLSGVVPFNVEDGSQHQAILYDRDPRMNLAIERDNLIWKVACKTGTLALSPGPGQMDVEKPLVLSADLFQEIKRAFDERAFPWVTVPETHGNGSLENTGYVRQLSVVDAHDPALPPELLAAYADDPEGTKLLLAGIEFTDPVARAKAESGSIPDTSIGVKFNYRNKRSGKLYAAAMEHLALTPVPWVDGLTPFGMGLSQGGGDLVDFNTELEYKHEGVFCTNQDGSCPLKLSDAGDILSSRDTAGILPPSERNAHNKETSGMTVEEALAQERAAREAAEARLAQAEQALQIQGTQLSAVTTRSRQTDVDEWARTQQLAGRDPEFINRARAIKLGQPVEGTDDAPVEGLALSVVTGVQEQDGQQVPQTLTLSGVDAVVDFLTEGLAPNPAGAAQVAHTMANLDTLNASQRPGAQQDNLAQLDKWEQENYPDRFNSDGSRKQPVSA